MILQSFVSYELNISKSFFNHTKNNEVIKEAHDRFAPNFTLNDKYLILDTFKMPEPGEAQINWKYAGSRARRDGAEGLFSEFQILANSKFEIRFIN